MRSPKWLRVTANLLAGIGALNWGLTVFKYNLVTAISNALTLTWFANTVYILVGLSGIYILIDLFTKKR